MSALRVFLTSVAFVLAAACESTTGVQRVCEGGIQVTIDSAHADWRTVALEYTEDLEPDEIVEPILHGVTLADSGLVTPYGGSIEYEFSSLVGSLVRIPAGGLRDMANDPLFDPSETIASIELNPGRCAN